MMKNRYHFLLSLTLVLTSFICVFNASAQNVEKNSAGLQAIESQLVLKWNLMQNDTYRQLKSVNSGPMGILNQDRDIELIGILPSGKPVFYGIDNVNAAMTILTHNVWPNGTGNYSYSGSTLPATAMGVWDGGAVLTSHQEFTGRVTQIDNPSSTHYHATHVAGTMVASGVQPSAQGMSYDADLNAYDWNSDEIEMANAANNDLLVSNHSYGTITGWRLSGSDWYWYGDVTQSQTEDYGFGYYSSSAQEWDEIAYDAPHYVICKSAGNDRNDYGPDTGGHYVWQNGNWEWSTATRDPDGGEDGYDCVSYNSNAKNIITVGAVDDVLNYEGPESVIMSSFSGWGPTDDGRIKPDIVANGIALYSTMDDATNSYDWLNGTSMSTPNLSGSIGLVFEAYMDVLEGEVPLAATIKSLLIHTARECGPNDGPDYMYGWGLADIHSAIDLIHDTQSNSSFIYEDQLTTVGENQYHFQSYGLEPAVITLAYTDIPGTPITNNRLNNTTPMLVNDLDITFERLSDNEIFYPYMLDPANPNDAATTGDNDLDNVEKIYLEMPEAGQYRIHVNYEGTLSGGSQNYSLIVSGLAPADDPTPPPSDLVAGHLGEGVVQLSWDSPPDVLSGFVELFDDGIADNFESDINTTFDIENGSISLAGNLQPFNSIIYKGSAYENALIEAEFKAGINLDNTFGLILNSNGKSQGTNNSLHFAISPKGYFALIAYDGFRSNVLIDWTFAEFINTGSSCWNVINALNLDGILQLQINSTTVASIENLPFDTGFTGIFTTSEFIKCSQIAVSSNENIINELFDSFALISAVDTPVSYESSTICPMPLVENTRIHSTGQIFNGNNNPFELTNQSDELDELLNYNIYREGELIGTSTTNNYSDQLPDFGNYSYTVTALYDEGESVHTSPASVTWANPVGEILIWDPDVVPGSAEAIEGVLNGLGYSTVYTTILTGYELTDYFMVLVTAGMYEGANTYSFVDGGTEETILIDYLEDDGKLYLEGGDVFGWANTRPDNLIPYFNLDGLSDGGSDLTSVQGDIGTLAEGIDLDYSGVNSYVDHIEPGIGSERILYNPSDGAGCGVLYDQGDYQTAAFSFELGMLEEAGGENSRTALIENIVDWFMNYPPEPFDLIAPEDEYSFTETAEPLMFSWDDAQDPENDDLRYTLWLASDPDFVNSAPFLADPPSATEYGVIMSDPGDYWWKVSVVDEADNLVWSNQTWSFTMLANQPPAAFNLLTPIEGEEVLNDTYVFTWEESTDPEDELVTYEVYLEEEGNPAELIGTTTENSLETTFTVNGVSLNWYVIAYDPSLANSTQSNQTISFIVNFPEAPGDFSLLTPENDYVSETGNVDLSWEESLDINIDDEVSYNVHLADNESFADEQIFTVNNALTHTLSDLPDNSEFWWKVEAVDLTDNSTYSTETWHFTVSVPEAPSVFTLLTPEEEFVFDTTFVEFSWEASIDPDPDSDLTYNIYLSQEPFDITSPPDPFAENIANPAFSTSLEDETVWYWTVKANDNNTDGTWADVIWAFVVSQPDPPSAFDLLTPVNGDTLFLSDSWSQQFSWSESIDPDPESTLSYTAYFHIFNTALEIDSTIVMEDLEVEVHDIDLIEIMGLQYWEEYLQLDWYVVAISDDAQVESTTHFTNYYEPNSNVPDQKFSGIPEEFSIASTYPNPFNPTVNIVVAVPERSILSVQIYDVLGRKVADLYEAPVDAGYQRVSWLAQGPSGVFFVRASAENGWSQISKIIYMK